MFGGLNLSLFKMKAVLAIAVIACFLAVASALDPFKCAQSVTELSSCIAMLGTATPDGDNDMFCKDCGNKLYAYYQDCANGVGTTGVKASKPKACEAIISSNKRYLGR